MKYPTVFHLVASVCGAGKTYLMDIDFMFVDSETLGKIIKEAREICIAGQKLLVPSLQHLIALKLHAVKYNPKIREYKDLSDIVELIRVNKLNTKDAGFKSLCLKYGTGGSFTVKY